MKKKQSMYKRYTEFNLFVAEFLMRIFSTMEFFWLATVANIIGLVAQPWEPALVVLNISNAFQLEVCVLTLFASSCAAKKYVIDRRRDMKASNKLKSEIDTIYTKLNRNEGAKT